MQKCFGNILGTQVGKTSHMWCDLYPLVALNIISYSNSKEEVHFFWMSILTYIYDDEQDAWNKYLNIDRI